MQMSDFVENRTFDEIVIGESASLARTLSKNKIALFACMSGDAAHVHPDQLHSETSMFHSSIGHGSGAGR